MPGDICKHCNKKCTIKGKNSEIIQCDICYVWVYASCESFSREQYKAFSDLSKSFPNLAYYCKLNGCFTRLNQLIARNDTSKPSTEIDEVFENLEKNYSSVNQAITTISENINQLSSNNTELKNKANNLAKSIESSGLESTVNNLAKSIESSLDQPKPPAWEFPATFTPSSVAINIADELSERNKRKCNIVVYNLPEPPTTNSQSDTNCFLDICHGSLDLNVEVIKSIRLGQKQTSRPRSLLLKLSNEASRNQVLSQAPKLRFSSTWNQIYTQPDMTPTEREAYRKLQEEIKRRKSLGESNLIIRNGKIIRYVPKKLKHACMLINNSSAVVESKDTPAPGVADHSTDNSSAPTVVEPNDSSTDDQNDVPMAQDSTTSS